MEKDLEKNGLDVLESAFFETVNSDEKVTVLASELERESIDWSNIFIDPQPGQSFILKFVTNPKGPKLTHRSEYKNLPDPTRKGKTFRWVSSGNAKTDPVLDLFFELYNEKKSGNVLAEKKINEFLTNSRQVCAIVQILNSPVPEQIGQFRLFSFSSSEKSELTVLINNKINPSKEILEADPDVKPEDIFDIFESSVLLLKTEEAEFDGVKGRSYAKSQFLSKKRGIMVPTEDGKFYEFSAEDRIVQNGRVVGVRDEAKPHFKKFLEILNEPNLSVHNYFAYKEIGNPNNTEETEEYLKIVTEKVKEIVPVIRNAKSIAEIKNYGKADDSEGIINGKTKTDIISDAVPDELNGLMDSDENVSANAASSSQTAATTKTDDEDIDDIINGIS